MLPTPHLCDTLRQTFPFLKKAGQDAINDLYTEGIYLKLNEQQFICMQGNQSRLLPLLLTGTVRIYDAGQNGREVTLYRLQPGEICTLTISCILSGKAFPANAVTEGPVEAIGVPAAILRRWMHQSEPWRTFIFGLFASRFSGMISVVNEVTFRRMDARIARYLVKATGARPTTLRTTHEAIAADLGSSREVVSRILQVFKHKALIDLSRKQIDVHDVNGLLSICQQA